MDILGTPTHSSSYSATLRPRFPRHIISQSLTLLLLQAHLWPSLVSSYAILSESWAMLSRGASEPRCLAIPANFSLCHGLEYTQMRLPNLLNHETIQEATGQAESWVPLLRLSCHPDAQLFLCSLFAPVCLGRHEAIKPCRSLCQAVKDGCESRMRYHGFPWPDILKCDQFPATHDMCIQPRATAGKIEDQKCSACKQIATIENIVDTFCRSSHVMKVSIKQAKPTFLHAKRNRVLKPATMDAALHRSMDLYFSTDGKQDCDCKSVVKSTSSGQVVKKRRYLVMANKDATEKLVLNMLLPWKREQSFKRVIRILKKLNCQELGAKIRNRARRERVRLYRNSGLKKSRTRGHRSLEADDSWFQSLEEDEE